MPNISDLRSLTGQQQRSSEFSSQLDIKTHVCNIRSLVSSCSCITTKPCRALSTRRSRRLPTTKNATLKPPMHFSKLILAAIGISFAVASPVPQNNNDALENCNTDCTNSYTICIEAEANTLEDLYWYFMQWISKLVVPLLTNESLARAMKPSAWVFVLYSMAKAELKIRPEEPPNYP